MNEKGKSIQLKFESKEDYELFNEKHADWVKEWNKESARIFGISGFRIIPQTICL